MPGEALSATGNKDQHQLPAVRYFLTGVLFPTPLSCGNGNSHVQPATCVVTPADSLHKITTVLDSTTYPLNWG